MMTKISRYCEGVMEAAWLVALAVVPLFFNVFSSRIFEPDKIALLRSIALIILAAWVVKLVEEGGFRRDRLRLEPPYSKSIARIPLIVPVLGIAVVYIIATQL
jgi:hypothetical protein